MELNAKIEKLRVERRRVKRKQRIEQRAEYAVHVDELADGQEDNQGDLYDRISERQATKSEETYDVVERIESKDERNDTYFRNITSGEITDKKSVIEKHQIELKELTELKKIQDAKKNADSAPILPKRIRNTNQRKQAASADGSYHITDERQPEQPQDVVESRDQDELQAVSETIRDDNHEFKEDIMEPTESEGNLKN